MSDERQKPEPQERRSEGGVLRVTTGSFRLPEGLEAEKTPDRDRIDAVVVVIVALALVFIAFIAWLIHGGQ
jgi:hypothetical protein